MEMEAVCFALDGTLGRYAADFGDYADWLRNELALHQCDMNAFARVLGEETRRDGPLTLALALGRVLDRLQQRRPPDLEGVAEAAARAYAADYRAAPGAETMLRECEVHGVRMALATNGPDDLQRAALAATGLARYFRAVIVSGDRDVASRMPAPRQYDLVCAGLELPPADVLMVGSDPDVEVGGAVAFGMRALVVDPVGRSAPPGVPVVAELADVVCFVAGRARVQ